MDNYIIINADDYGLNSSVSAAIYNLALKKMITSTTILSNYASEEDLKKLLDIGLDAGLHLNLIEGKPVSAAANVPSLVDKRGNFYPWFQLLQRYTAGMIKKDELRIEIKNQLDFLQSHGINVTHADSHKHIHQFPLLGPVILTYLKELGIRKIRKVRPVSWVNPRMSLLKGFNMITEESLHAFIHPDCLFTYFSTHGHSDFSGFGKRLQKTIPFFSCIEIMTHPAMQNTVGSSVNSKAEYDYLLNHFQADLNKIETIEFISYKSLK